MTVGPVAAAPLVASGTSGHVSNTIDHAAGNGLDAQLQTDEQGATGIAGDVQLSDARTTFHGEAANDSLGETVVGIGDVTGDGTDDVALGAPEAADGAGAIHHFFGPVAEGDLDASESDLTLTGEESGDWAGADVAAADLTGDGLRDLIVGAPQANAGTGAVYVFYGADLRAAVDDGASELSLADASVTMTGDGEGDQFGTAVAAHGHEHAGDDAPMLAVGAPGADGEAGAVYTFSDVTSDAAASDANAVVTGPAQGDQAGWSLATADNYTDAGDAALIVGAPNHDDTGAVGILTDVSGDASLADADRLLLGEGDGDRAGWAVDESGDVDGDGLTDVVIGAPLNDASGEDAGAAYVVHANSHQAGSTNLADADAIVRGEDAGDTAGYDVSAAGSGDVTCDEYDDVLVGAPGHDANGQQDAGAAYIVAGGDTLQGDDSLSTAQAKLHGENAGDLAGFSVADAMDATDNGDEDVLVGAPGADKKAGAAYLVEGECPGDGVAEEPRTDEPVVEEPDKEEPKEEEPKEEEPAREEPADKEDRDEDVDKDKDADQDAGDDRDEDDDKDVEDDRDEADKEREDDQDGDVGDGDDKDGDDKDGDGKDGDGDVGDGDGGDDGDESDFEFIAVDKPTEIVEGNHFATTWTIENTGTAAGNATVELTIDGDQVDSDDVEIGANETGTVDLTWKSEEAEPGNYTVGLVINGQQVHTQNLWILEDDEEQPETNFEFISVDKPTEIVEGNHFATTWTIQNNGTAAGNATVALTIDGDVVDSDEVEIDANDTGTVDLTWAAEDAPPGNYTVGLEIDGTEVHTQNLWILEDDEEQPETNFEFIAVDKATEIVEGNHFATTWTIQNNGTAAGTATVELTIDGEGVVDSDQVEIDANGTGTVDLTWAAEEEAPGNYTVGLVIDGTVVHTQNLRILDDEDDGQQQPAVDQPIQPQDLQVTIDCDEQTGVANATVTNPNGVAVTVSIAGVGEQILEAGQTVSFEDVPNVDYDVTASYDGDEFFSDTVTVDCDEN